MNVGRAPLSGSPNSVGRATRRCPTQSSRHARGFLPHQAPSPLRLQRSQRAEGQGARRRARRDRPRHGQSRRPDPRAHRRQADRGGAEPENPRLFGVARHRRAAPRLRRLLRPPLQCRARSRARGHRHVGLEGGARQSGAGDHRAGRHRAGAEPVLSDPRLRLHHGRRLGAARAGRPRIRLSRRIEKGGAAQHPARRWRSC